VPALRAAGVDPDLRNDRSFLFELLVDGGDPAELRLLPVEIDEFSVDRTTDAAAG
jgi:poly-gamma-glutamate synthesis protein (capsule biosynthesis protein)